MNSYQFISLTKMESNRSVIEVLKFVTETYYYDI